MSSLVAVIRSSSSTSTTTTSSSSTSGDFLFNFFHRVGQCEALFFMLIQKNNFVCKITSKKFPILTNLLLTLQPCVTQTNLFVWTSHHQDIWHGPGLCSSKSCDLLQTSVHQEVFLTNFVFNLAQYVPNDHQKCVHQFSFSL